MVEDKGTKAHPLGDKVSGPGWGTSERQRDHWEEAGNNSIAAFRRAREGRTSARGLSIMPLTITSSNQSLERGPGTDLTSWMCLVPFATSRVIGNESQGSEWKKGRSVTLLQRGRGERLLAWSETWLAESYLQDEWGLFTFVGRGDLEKEKKRCFFVSKFQREEEIVC